MNLNDLLSPSVSLGVVIFITILTIVLWRVRQARFNRQIVISAIAALLLFQILFFLQGSYALPGAEAGLDQKLLVATGIILAFNALVQLIKWLLVEFLISRQRIRLPRFVLDTLGLVAIVGIALSVASRVFGIELTGVLVTSTVVSAVIGLSLQDILGNLFSGISLQIESPFTVDDWVELAGQEGRVVSQNWRTLAILTRQNYQIILTNNSVANDKIVNFSRPTPVQATDVFIGVAYQHPPNDVKRVLFAALLGVEGILEAPAPKVLVVQYDDFSINYRVRFWFRDYARKLELEDAVLTRFWYALKRAGMGIPFPIRDVNMRVVPRDHEAKQKAAARNQIVAALRPLPFLEAWTDIQIVHLAEGAELALYTQGEVLVREGDEGDSLFIIVSGRVEIYFKGKHGGDVYSGERISGEFFGEMSLLTGEPRSASVIATEDTEVIVIGKRQFAEVLTADPGILELFVAALETRRDLMQTQLADASARRQPETPSSRAAFLKRITDFLFN